MGMKKVSPIEYWDQMWEVSVPESAMVVPGPPKEQIIPALPDPAKAVKEALDNPIDIDRIPNLVKKGSKVTIAFNDWMGCSVFAVPAALEELKKAGVNEKDIKLISAGGNHAKLANRDEFLHSPPGRWVPLPYPSTFHPLPPEVLDKFWPAGSFTRRVYAHDCEDKENLAYLGESELGDIVEVNKDVVESDLTIYCGWAAFPSQWGGILGGGVGVAVGLGSARQIRSSHTMAAFHEPTGHSDPKTQRLMEHKKAICKKIEEGIGQKIFYIEGYLNVNAQFAGFFTGSGERLMKAEMKLSEKEKIVTIPRQADIMIAGTAKYGFYDTTNNPLLTVIQATNLLRLHLGPYPPVREGGVIILASPCTGDISEQYKPFLPELIALYHKVGHNAWEMAYYEDDFANRPEWIYGYRFQHKFHPIHGFWCINENQFTLDHTSRVIVAGATNKEAVLSAGATPTKNFDDAWELALKLVGTREPDVLAMPGQSHRTNIWLKAEKKA